MSKEIRLKRWRAVLAKRGWTIPQAAIMLGIKPQVLYNWNCGLQPIPPKRLKQLEEMGK